MGRARARVSGGWLLLGAALLIVATACGTISKPQGWAAPRPEGSVLYASINTGKMAALNMPDNSVKWEFPPANSPKSLNPEAIYGQPAVSSSGDTVYFGAYDGYVYALKASDGSPAWNRFQTNGPIIAPVILTGTKLYAASMDGNLYLLDASTGKETARFESGDQIWAAPLVSGNRVYIANMKGQFFALDSDTLRPAGGNSFKASAGLLTDPVRAETNLILVGGIDHKLYALDDATGQAKWTFKGGNWFWAKPLVVTDNPPIAGGVAYAADLNGVVYALRLGDGTKAWEFDTKGSLRAAPVIAGGVLVAVNSDGRAFGLEPATGKQKWGPTLLNNTVYADPVMLNDRLLVAAQGGKLFQLDPSNGSSTLIAVKK